MYDEICKKVNTSRSRHLTPVHKPKHLGYKCSTRVVHLHSTHLYLLRKNYPI